MVNSVYRAAEILNMLSLGKNRITDIYKELDLSKSTTHRLLKTLEECGFVFQDPTSHQYFLGHLIIKLSSDPLITHQNLILSAYEEMRMLRDASGETIALFIPIGMQRLCLEEIDANQSIKYVVEKGSVSALYAGAAGKVLLSELPEGKRDSLCEKLTFKQIAPNTVTDRNLFRKQLDAVKKQGYAISSGETLEGALSISVPVRGYTCPVALSILGPQYRFKPKIMDLKETIKASARRISDKIGPM